MVATMVGDVGCGMHRGCGFQRVVRIAVVRLVCQRHPSSLPKVRFVDGHLGQQCNFRPNGLWLD